MKRTHKNYFAIIGLAACLSSGALEALQAWQRGPNESTLLHLFARWLAACFRQPPSLLRAGSDYLELVVTIYLAGVIALTIAIGTMLWQRHAQRAGNALLAAQAALALMLPSLMQIVVTAEVAFLLPLRAGLRWLGALVVLGFAVGISAWLIGVDGESDNWLRIKMVEMAKVAAWQCVAYAVGYLAASEQRRSVALAAANAELQATQLLLADTVRASERMRIARDLHDIVGHQLTALNLHLELAQRQCGAQAPEGVHTSRELANSLLAQVREVVAAERDQRIDLHDALAALCAGIPSPRVQLAMAANLDVTSPAVAHAVFCCVQEALSNVMRHARASMVHISIEQDEGELQVSVLDDGRGHGGAPEGNGLRGMRERLSLLGGSLCVQHGERGGFGLALRVPAGGAA